MTVARDVCQLLTEARLRVHYAGLDRVIVFVRGFDGETVRVQWDQDGAWSCTCDGDEALCAHVSAAQLVIDRPRAEVVS